MDIQDIRLLLPESVSLILDTYDCEVSTWEQVIFMLQNKRKGQIVLSREEEDGIISGKLLKIDGPGKYSLEPYSRQDGVL